MKKLILGIAALAACVNVDAASITVAGRTFDSVQMVDSVISGSGVFQTSLADDVGVYSNEVLRVVTDNDPESYAFSWDPGAFLELGFTDNILFNGPGADLMVVETGVPDFFRFSLSVGGPSLLVETSFIGERGATTRLSINPVFIDLSDLGVGLNAAVTSFVLGMDYSHPLYDTEPSLSMAVALNSRLVDPPSTSVPEPASWALLLFGLPLLAFQQKKVFV
ncbi:MAG: hypothetical protein PHC51_05870 [bacterium]|nr:hypothetical protein [bacterium]